MKDEHKTKAQLIGELMELRQLTANLQAFKLERKKSLNDLQLFRDLIDRSNDAIFIVSPETGRFLDFNATACRTLGYKRDELLNMCVRDICTDVTDDSVWHKKVEAATEKEQLILEGYQRRKDGITIPVELNVRYVSLGGKVYLTVISRDITERRKTEAALKESEEQLHLITDSLPALIAYVDSDQRYRFNNRAYEDWFGHSSKGLFGKHLKQVLGRKAYQAIEIYIGQALAGRQVSFESMVPYKVGGTRYVHATYVPDFNERGDVRGFFALVIDITESVKAEEELRARDAAIASSISGIAMTDMEAKLTYVNEAFLKLWGYDDEKEVLGRSATGFWQDEEKALELIKQLKDKGCWVGELVGQKKDGTSVDIQLAASLVKDRNGKPVSMFGSFIDVTGHKRAEKYLKESESKLQKQKLALEQKNTALSELIEQIDIEKKKLKEDIATYVIKTLLPTVSKLKVSEDSLRHRDLLKYNLEDLLSSFGRSITLNSCKLTPKETEICNMIKCGLATKEICNLLFVSPQTVEKHRKNIRKKIGISNKKINLASFLDTL